jgi:hypothetical protein
MPDEYPRLFLSYGVHDASELAERLRLDLTARGYQVWWDVNRIRAGLPWDEEVQTGLRNSQVLLALLSPHSVRRALDAGNPTETDSVCLDEIEYAQRACKMIPARQVFSSAQKATGSWWARQAERWGFGMYLPNARHQLHNSSFHTTLGFNRLPLVLMGAGWWRVAKMAAAACQNFEAKLSRAPSFCRGCIKGGSGKLYLRPIVDGS